MATILTKSIAEHSSRHSVSVGSLARFALISLLPLAAFGAVNYAGEAMRILPLFFSPVGMPGWAGAAIHLAVLLSIGVALALAAQSGRSMTALTIWGTAYVAGVIAYPFLAPVLDSLGLALTLTVVLVLGLATSIRITKHSAAAGWLMLPALGWLGFGAVLGLAVAAAWSPPFALVNAQHPAPASA
jgi:tryptophan-rich sensory protein